MAAVRLTGKDRSALSYIDQFCELYGYSPTFQEVGVAIGWDSKSTVAQHLNKLRRVGLVEWEPGCPRTLHLTEKARA